MLACSAQLSSGEGKGAGEGEGEGAGSEAVQCLCMFSYTEQMEEVNKTAASYLSLLSDLGIHARLPGGLSPAGWGDAFLMRGESGQSYSVFVRENFTLADAGWIGKERGPVLVLSGFLSQRTSDALRRADVQFLDAAGNAWITFADVLIDVRGRPRPKDAKPVPATGNLFSTARAQVVFALLVWPELWDAPVRDLARAADTSVGQAHNARRLLAEAGYQEGPRPAGLPDLLDLWTAAYPTGLAARLTRATYSGAIDRVQAPSEQEVIYVSGECAAPELLRPVSLTLYTPTADPRLPVVNRWRSDGPANIEIRHAFWRAPSGDQPGVQPAPWPMVYADLAASDDPRVRQAAQDWRQSHA